MDVMLKEEELPSRVEERAPGLEEVGLARLATAVSALATLGMMTVEMTLKDAASSRFAWPSPPRCGVACRVACGVPCGVPRLRARRLLVSTKESWMSLREIMRWLARLVAKVLRSLVPKALMLGTCFCYESAPGQFSKGVDVFIRIQGSFIHMSCDAGSCECSAARFM